MIHPPCSVESQRDKWVMMHILGACSLSRNVNTLELHKYLVSSKDGWNVI